MDPVGVGVDLGLKRRDWVRRRQVTETKSMQIKMQGRCLVTRLQILVFIRSINIPYNNAHRHTSNAKNLVKKSHNFN